MALSEIEHKHALAAIARAGVDDAAWEAALPLIMKSANGWASQILAVSPAGGIHFNLGSGLPDGVLKEFELRGGENPQINYRARIFSRPAYAINCDQSLGSTEEYRTSAFFNDFIYKVDCQDVCITNLPRIGPVMTCVVVLKSRSQIGLSTSDQASFQSLMRPIKAALTFRSKLGQNHAAVMAGSFAAFGEIAFVVDHAGRLLALTPRAETMLQAGRFLLYRQEQILPRHLSDRPRFEAALRAACRTPGSENVMPFSRILIREDNATVIAEIAPFPNSDWSTHFGPSAIVLVKTPRTGHREELLRQAFRLSQSEVEIAVALLRGEDVSAIAEKRGVSAATVRSQMKSIFAKTGVHKQSQLVALIGKFA